MNALDLRRALKAQGITEFQTMAGWLPVDRFDPYGLAPPDPETGAPAGPNYHEHFTTRYDGEIITRADGSLAVRDLGDARYPFVLGSFPVR